MYYQVPKEKQRRTFSLSSPSVESGQPTGRYHTGTIAPEDARLHYQAKPTHIASPVIQRRIDIGYDVGSSQWGVKADGRPKFTTKIENFFGKRKAKVTSLNHIFSFDAIQSFMVDILKGGLQGKKPLEISSDKPQTDAGKDLRRLVKMLAPDPNTVPSAAALKLGPDPDNELLKLVAAQREEFLTQVQELDNELQSTVINTQGVIGVVNHLETELNSSVANLRIGDARINSSIRERLDPLFSTATYADGTVSVDARKDEQTGFAKRMHKFARLVETHPDAEISGFRVVGNQLYTSDDSSISLSNQPQPVSVSVKHMKSNGIIANHTLYQNKNGDITDANVYYEFEDAVNYLNQIKDGMIASCEQSLGNQVKMSECITEKGLSAQIEIICSQTLRDISNNIGNNLDLNVLAQKLQNSLNQYILTQLNKGLTIKIYEVYTTNDDKFINIVHMLVNEHFEDLYRSISHIILEQYQAQYGDMYSEYEGNALLECSNCRQAMMQENEDGLAELIKNVLSHRLLEIFSEQIVSDIKKEEAEFVMDRADEQNPLVAQILQQRAEDKMSQAEILDILPWSEIWEEIRQEAIKKYAYRQ